MAEGEVEQSVALDRAGITVFRDITFLAAGPASERSRSARLPKKSPIARNQRMATVAQKRATLDDLYRTPEKAELIAGGPEKRAE